MKTKLLATMTMTLMIGSGTINAYAAGDEVITSEDIKIINETIQDGEGSIEIKGDAKDILADHITTDEKENFVVHIQNDEERLIEADTTAGKALAEMMIQSLEDRDGDTLFDLTKIEWNDEEVVLHYEDKTTEILKNDSDIGKLLIETKERLAAEESDLGLT